MSARFHELEVSSGLKDRKKLSEYLDELIKKHRKSIRKIALTYIFCTDEYLLDINQKFLDHDTYTDIITFDMSDNNDELKGEIYISIDRVADNAAKMNVSKKEELHRVIFHGALHLCGFKDKTKADKEQMRSMEDNCLKEYLK